LAKTPKSSPAENLSSPLNHPFPFKPLIQTAKKQGARLEQELVVILSGRQGREGSGAEWQKCGSHFCAQTALLVIPSGTEPFAQRAIL